MTIVEVQHTQMLMVSGIDAMRSGYGEATTDTWGDDEGGYAKEYKNPVDWDE